MEWIAPAKYRMANGEIATISRRSHFTLLEGITIHDGERRFAMWNIRNPTGKSPYDGGRAYPFFINKHYYNSNVDKPQVMDYELIERL